MRRNQGRKVFIVILGRLGWDFALKLAELGVLVRPGGKDMIVRFLPPLVINEE
jgi:acetylornithine/succinyldiaminopimelate/putrescine aminotransferase